MLKRELIALQLKIEKEDVEYYIIFRIIIIKTDEFIFLISNKYAQLI